MTPADRIPQNVRDPHPAAAVFDGRALTKAERGWQRVLEIVAWRAPYADVYLRGSRFLYADKREVHFEVIGEVAVRVLKWSPEIDTLHEALYEVTTRRRMPVPHLSETIHTDEERDGFARDIARAQAVVRETFAGAE